MELDFYYLHFRLKFTKREKQYLEKGCGDNFNVGVWCVAVEDREASGDQRSMGPWEGASICVGG